MYEILTSKGIKQTFPSAGTQAFNEGWIISRLADHIHSVMSLRICPCRTVYPGCSRTHEF